MDDSVGNREVLIDPEGGRFTSTYDSLNRASSIKDPDGNLTTFQYNSASQRTTLTDANGNTRQYAYDVAGRLTTQIELNAGSNPILTIVDAYDSVGNRTGRNQDTGDCEYTFCYELGGLGHQIVCVPHDCGVSGVGLGNGCRCFGFRPWAWPSPAGAGQVVCEDRLFQSGTPRGYTCVSVPAPCDRLCPCLTGCVSLYYYMPFIWFPWTQCHGFTNCFHRCSADSGIPAPF